MPGRNPETFASSFAVESPRSSLLSASGAVMSRVLELVEGLSTSLYRGAARDPQGTDHFHLAVGVFGLACCCACEHRPCRQLGIYGIGLAGAVLVAALGRIHLEDPCPLGSQEAGKSGTEGARAFYPDALQGTEPVRPLRELFVAAPCRRDAQGAEASAEAIQGNGDVEVLVGIHAQSDPYGTCGDASHVFFLPSIGE